MKLNWKLIALILITFTLIIFWYTRETLQDIIQKSNGTFDVHAQRAIEQYNNTRNPTANESFDIANVVQLNIHEGHIQDPTDFMFVVDAYENVIDNEGNEENDIDWFQIAQIENFIWRNADNVDNNIILHDLYERNIRIAPKKIKRTVEQAKQEGKTKSEAIDIFVNTNKEHTSDPQNVHDSSVNLLFKKFHENLEQTSDKNKNCYNELLQTINASDKSSIQKQNAITSLDTIWASGQNEVQTLNLVWDRSHHPSNTENSELLKEAVIDSLIDMKQDTGIVCSTGRTNRIIGSLATLDYDPKISGFFTVEQVRNDALDISKQLLDDTVLEYKNSDNEKKKTVGNSYDSTTFMETDPETEQEFKKLVVEKIENTFERDLKDKLTERDYDKIKQHCIAAVEI